jgi:hypothetical protein
MSAASRRLQRDDSEDELEQAAAKILAEIRSRVEEIGGRSGHASRTKDRQMQWPGINSSSQLQCICCLLPVENGEFFLTMPCCGRIAHVVCMARVSNGHPSRMCHACPHCLTGLEPSLETIWLSMWRFLGGQVKDDDGT